MAEIVQFRRYYHDESELLSFMISDSPSLSLYRHHVRHPMFAPYIYQLITHVPRLIQLFMSRTGTFKEIWNNTFHTPKIKTYRMSCRYIVIYICCWWWSNRYKPRSTIVRLANAYQSNIDMSEYVRYATYIVQYSSNVDKKIQKFFVVEMRKK